MKPNSSNNIIYVLIAISVFLLNSYDYPKTRLEQEMDEMGSVLGGEGIVLRPGKVKSDSTKKIVGNVNKYLYDASLETLKFAPIISSDADSGIILTDWYASSDKTEAQFKIAVYITGDVISPEALEVRAFERRKSKNDWSGSTRKTTLSNAIEDKILRKARNMYLQEQKK